MRLERNAAAAGVLKEETTVDLTLVKVGLLETSVGNVVSTSGLLEDAHLELAETSKVDGQRTSDLPELLLAGGVEDGCLAGGLLVYVFEIGVRGNVLLGVVEGHSKVLPLGLVDLNVPEPLAGAVKNLELVLVGIALSNKRSSLELDLVVAEVSSLVPDVEVLVGEVQRPGGVLLDTPVEGLDTLATLAVRGILEELQTGAAESQLLLEDGLIGDGHLNSLELVAIEARGLVGELQDLRPGQVVTLDEVGVEERVGGLSVEGDGCHVGRDTAVEDDGALGLSGASDMGVKGGCSQCSGGN